MERYLVCTVFLLAMAGTLGAESPQPANQSNPDPAQQELEAIKKLRLPSQVFNIEGLDKAAIRLQIRALYNHAVLLNYSNQFGQVRPLLQQMDQLSPDAPETNYLRAMDFYFRKQMAQAIVYARKAVDASSALDPAWNFLGFLHSQAGNEDKALDCFLKAIESNPYQAVYRFNAANAFSRGGKADEALEQIDQAIRIRPNYSEAYYLKALILREQKNYEAAFQTMILAEQTGAKDVPFYLNFIDIARIADHPDKLLELMESTSRMRDFGLFRIRGIVYSDYGECNQAIGLLSAVPADQMNVDAYRAFGKCLLIQNRNTDAYIKSWNLTDEQKEGLQNYLKNLEITNKKWPEVKDPIVAPPE